MKKSVAVTGMGLVTPGGRGAEVSWQMLESGTSAISRFPEKGRTNGLAWAGMAGEVEPPDDADRQVQVQWKFLNRGGRLGLIAAYDAMAEAALPDSVPPHRRALFLATGDLTTADCARLRPATHAASNGSWRELEPELLNRAAARDVYPFFLLETLANNPFSAICIAVGATGSSTCLASHSPGGAQALELAFRSVRHGRADAAVVVGCGSWLSPLPMLEMDGLGVLSGCRSGAGSYRPFDRRRDGFIVGEGAAALMLEPEEQARQRSAPILAVLEGVGSATEPVSGLGVAKQVAVRSVQTALDAAGVTPRDLGFMCAHGSGTPRGDASELRSIAFVLGDQDTKVPICALKPYTGHMGAASDIAEVVFGILATRRQTVPATLNFRSSDEPFSDLRIASAPQRCRSSRFLSVSFGVGGQSSAVVVAVG